MKTASLFTLVALIMCMGACKKSGSSDNSTTDNPAGSKVKSVTYLTKQNNAVTYSITYNFLYNGNDQIIGTESTTPPGHYSSFEAAGGNKYSYRHYMDSTLFIIRDAFVIPGSLLVDSAYEINTNLGDTLEIKYHYNGSSQLVSSDEVNHSRYQADLLTHIDYTYDSEGNVITEVKNYDGAIYTTTYTYDTKIPMSASAPDGYFPRIQKQWPTKLKHDNPYTASDEVFYEYTFDSHNRVTSATTSWTKYPDQSNVTEYEYY